MPLTTTHIHVGRWSVTQPGKLVTVARRFPAVVGRISGKELYAYRGQAEGGYKEDVSAKLNTDLREIRYNDIVTDLGTDTSYRAVWARYRQGLGMDHMESGLAIYAPTDTYSVYRGFLLDGDGDQIPAMPGSSQPVAVNLPGEVREVARDTQGPVTMQPGSARTIAGRFPPGVTLLPQDRLLAETSGIVYVVTAMGLVGEGSPADVGVELTKITV